ncbi:MAG: zinc ribbon domain-containing protein [Phycisphaerales bacterium]|nr:zinc ribbon domain-containing protein [Phycisphaerales bacterium]
MIADPTPTPHANVGGIELAINPAGISMRRAFLWTLIISVALCAVIAILTLLFARFTDTTVRILSTLGAIGGYAAASVFCATTLDRGLWPVLSRVGLGLFAIALALVMAAIWAVSDWETIGQLNGTATAIAVLYLYAIPGADLLERRAAPRLGLIALIAAVVSFCYTLVAIWFLLPAGGGNSIMRAAMTSHVIAICLAHAGLLVRVAVPSNLAWMRLAAFASIAAFGSLVSAFILFDLKGDFVLRLMGALGVFDVSSTVALLIMWRLRRVDESEQRLVAQAQISLSCPRCGAQQCVTTGNCACASCGLRFKIEVEEPRCAGCQYPLWNLPNHRCPECGREF